MDEEEEMREINGPPAAAAIAAPAAAAAAVISPYRMNPGYREAIQRHFGLKSIFLVHFWAIY